MKITLADVPGLLGLASIAAGGFVVSIAAGLVVTGATLLVLSWLLSGRDS